MRRFCLKAVLHASGGDYVKRTVAVAVFAFVLLAPCAFGQVNVLVGDVKETRRSDGFFNKLEVDIKVFGDLITEVKGIRVNVARAVDGTGKNLIDPKQSATSFDDVDTSDSESLKVTLELKQAARRAIAVTEISGVLELFVPGRDPAATVTLADITKAQGGQVRNAALGAAGVDLTVWNKQQYDAQRKTEEERIKKQIEEKKKSGTPEEQAEIGEALANGLMKIFGGLFNAMTDMSENGVALQVSDKQRKVIKIEFEDAEGKPISSQGRTTMGSDPKTMIFDFSEKLPDTARIKVYLLTPRSVVKSPFRLSNVPLP
jgi:hypothetical protein